MFNLEQSITNWRKQMLAAGIKTPVPLEELEIHLREEIEQQMKSGLNEQEAFISAVKKIGQAVTLKTEFSKIGKTKGYNMINHNRIYSATLAIFALFAVIGCSLTLFLAGLSKAGPIGLQVPDWSLRWLAAINFAYAVAIIVTVFIRRYRPVLGRRLTRILNWTLLPALPGGTVIGIYGLWKVDREKL
jgi:hypothetical protein